MRSIKSSETWLPIKDLKKYNNKRQANMEGKDVMVPQSKIKNYGWHLMRAGESLPQ